MEIASLKKFAILTKAKKEGNLIFFTPSEELKGANIFSKLSNRYSIVQPYLEKIDSEFIQQMNKNVQNIAFYLKSEETEEESRGVVIDNIE